MPVPSENCDHKHTKDSCCKSGLIGPNVVPVKSDNTEPCCDNPLGICLPSYKSRGSTSIKFETPKPDKTEPLCDNPLGICLPSYKSRGSSGPIVANVKPDKTEPLCDNPLGICLPSYKSRGASGPIVANVRAVMTGPVCDNCAPQKDNSLTAKNVGSAKAGPYSDNSRGCCVPSFKGSTGPIVGTAVEEVQTWRRHCGCIRTSEKLKHILKTFPNPPPPSPAPNLAVMQNAYDKQGCHYAGFDTCMQSMEKAEYIANRKAINNRSWQVVAELVQLVQLSVTATALALYYLIYCYMQLVYYTLRSALYFHNADGPMKITIGVVTVTSLVVGFNLMLRMERILGILY